MLALAGCATVREAPRNTAPVPASPAPAAEPVTPSAVGTACEGPGYAAAADFNRVAETELSFSPFGRPETGWALYVPQISETIGAGCVPESQGFAKAVAAWQAAHGLTPDGALSPETFLTLKGVWQERRPFVMLRVQGICPAGADEGSLATLNPDEALGDKPVRMRPEALSALRRMRAEAQRDVPDARDDPNLLAAFSAYRSPAADAARCEVEHNCQGTVRAQCSAHRTGLAVDLDVGFAPGFKADNSADFNRLYQSRTPTYRWLVRNAARFGFVNYVFEPWHWEWTGEAPQLSTGLKP